MISIHFQTKVLQWKVISRKRAFDWYINHMTLKEFILEKRAIYIISYQAWPKSWFLGIFLFFMRNVFHCAKFHAFVQQVRCLLFLLLIHLTTLFKEVRASKYFRWFLLAFGCVVEVKKTHTNEIKMCPFHVFLEFMTCKSVFVT